MVPHRYGKVRLAFKDFVQPKDTMTIDVDAKAAKAEYKDGVLNLTLPKKGNGSARRIAVS